MAVSTVTLTHAPPTGGDNDGGDRSYTLKYRVVTTDEDDGPKIVLAGSGLPSIGSGYAWNNDADGGATCRSRKANRDKSKRTEWEVTCTYSSAIDNEDSEEQGNGSTGNDPMDEWPEISLDTQNYTKAVQEDIDGDTIIMSDGSPVAGGLPCEGSRIVLRIARNEITFDGQAAAQYANTVNENNFNVNQNGFSFRAAAKTLLMKGSPKATRKFRRTELNPNGQFFWRVTYELHYEKNGHSKKVLDMGFGAMDDDQDGTKNVTQSTQFGTQVIVVGRLRNKDKLGRPKATPSLLDGQGNVLADGEKGHLNTWTIYHSMDFNDLGLPNNQP